MLSISLSEAGWPFNNNFDLEWVAYLPSSWYFHTKLIRYLLMWYSVYSYTPIFVKFNDNDHLIDHNFESEAGWPHNNNIFIKWWFPNDDVSEVYMKNELHNHNLRLFFD